LNKFVVFNKYYSTHTNHRTTLTTHTTLSLSTMSSAPAPVDDDLAAAFAASLREENRHDAFLRKRFPDGLNVDGIDLLCLWYCLLHYLGREMTPENARTLSLEIGFPEDYDLKMGDATVVLPKFFEKFKCRVTVSTYCENDFAHKKTFGTVGPNELHLILRNEHFMLADARQKYNDLISNIKHQQEFIDRDAAYARSLADEALAQAEQKRADAEFAQAEQKRADEALARAEQKRADAEFAQAEQKLADAELVRAKQERADAKTARRLADQERTDAALAQAEQKLADAEFARAEQVRADAKTARRLADQERADAALARQLMASNNE